MILRKVRLKTTSEELDEYLREHDIESIERFEEAFFPRQWTEGNKRRRSLPRDL